ncbi:hypothetical protein RhiJN_06539 [Ceratobasidium sp. AG-Ba]|nr:hypothetical protein RhiJN_06539 [Ceratobasidium sp. AG-Ba]QRW07455.1 hypothetical protein RhiLY_06454 [Ceratobasidium sp. AG-Ba]
MCFVEIAKYFVFTVLAYLDISTYAGITAIDFGARVIHASVYVGLSRAGLQLPIGAFVPPPSPFSTGSLMLYVTPAAVASSPSVVDALHDVPKVLNIGYQTVRYVAETLAAHHQRLAQTLIQAPPSSLVTSQSAYISVSWSHPTGSSLGLSSPAYSRLAFPAFNLSSWSTLLHDIILGLSPADHRAPFLAAISLRQRTSWCASHPTGFDRSGHESRRCGHPCRGRNAGTEQVRKVDGGRGIRVGPKLPDNRHSGHYTHALLHNWAVYFLLRPGCW